METIQKKLQLIFWIPIVLSAIIIILGELDIIPNGILANDKQVEFVIMSMMEILTIIAIPVALKLFKFKAIANKLASDTLLHFERWGIVRLCLLNVPMVINLVCYYLFVGADFGYLAIILFLSLFFVYPSLSRCYNETDGHNS